MESDRAQFTSAGECCLSTVLSTPPHGFGRSIGMRHASQSVDVSDLFEPVSPPLVAAVALPFRWSVL